MSQVFRFPNLKPLLQGHDTKAELASFMRELENLETKMEWIQQLQAPLLVFIQEKQEEMKTSLMTFAQVGMFLNVVLQSFAHYLDTFDSQCRSVKDCHEPILITNVGPFPIAFFYEQGWITGFTNSQSCVSLEEKWDHQEYSPRMIQTSLDNLNHEVYLEIWQVLQENNLHEQIPMDKKQKQSQLLSLVDQPILRPSRKSDDFYQLRQSFPSSEWIQSLHRQLWSLLQRYQEEMKRSLRMRQELAMFVDLVLDKFMNVVTENLDTVIFNGRPEPFDLMIMFSGGDFLGFTTSTRAVSESDEINWWDLTLRPRGIGIFMEDLNAEVQTHIVTALKEKGLYSLILKEFDKKSKKEKRSVPSSGSATRCHIL